MKRLTEYEIIAGHVHAVPTDDADKAMMSLAAYEDTGLEPEAVRRLLQDWTSLIMTIDELGGMQHLRELVQAEQDGRLVVLPCKVGGVCQKPPRTDCLRQCRIYPPELRGRQSWTMGCDRLLPRIQRNGKKWTLPRSPATYHVLRLRGFRQNRLPTREEAEAALTKEGGTDEDSGGL